MVISGHVARWSSVVILKPLSPLTATLPERPPEALSYLTAMYPVGHYVCLYNIYVNVKS